MAIDFNSKVTGPVSSVEGNVAVFSGTTGKVVKDSGFKIAKSVPADAKFTDTVVTVNNTLTSDSTSAALSAAQGKALKNLVDGKAASNHTHSNYATSSHTHSNYVLNSNGGNISIHADSDSSSASEYALIKAGHNELKVISSAGGSTVTKGQDKLQFNGYSVYHKGYKPSLSDLGAAASNHTHDYAASNHTHSNYAASSHTHNYAGSSSAGGNANAAVKLATARGIGCTTFDGSKDISLYSVLGLTQSSSTGQNNGGKATKIASITLNGPWDSCIGKLFISSVESIRLSGILSFFFKCNDVITSTNIDLIWETLSNNEYEESIQAVKTADGKFDLYFISKYSYETITFHAISNNEHAMKLHTNQSYINVPTSIAKSKGSSSVFNELLQVHSRRGVSTQIEVTRKDFNKGINLTISSNGADHGLYSTYFNNWMIRGNDTEVKYAFKNEWNGQLGLIGIRCGSNLSGVSGYLTFSL